MNPSTIHPRLRELQETLSSTSQPLDEEILPLLDSLFRLPGIVTSYSCAGHGKRWPVIGFGIVDPVAGVDSLRRICRAAEYFDWFAVAHANGFNTDHLISFTLAPAQAFRESSGTLAPACQTECTGEALDEMERIAEIALHIRTMRTV